MTHETGRRNDDGVVRCVWHGEGQGRFRSLSSWLLFLLMGGRQAGGATPLWVALELGFATGRVHFGAPHFESWTMGNAVGDRQPSTTLTMMTFRSICSALKALRKSKVKHWRHIHTQTHAAGATFRSKEPTEKKKTQRKRRRRES